MADALDEALRIVREGAKLDTAPSMKALAAEIERLYAIEEVVLAVPALVAEVERLRAIEAALDADAAQGDPCVLCGSHGPVALVASRRGSFWLCEDATSCRARKGGAK